MALVFLLTFSLSSTSVCGRKMLISISFNLQPDEILPKARGKPSDAAARPPAWHTRRRPLVDSREDGRVAAVAKPSHLRLPFYLRPHLSIYNGFLNLNVTRHTEQWQKALTPARSCGSWDLDLCQEHAHCCLQHS